MKALVVYDSVYGNTEKIAKAIGHAIDGEIKVISAGEADPADIKSIDILIVGSPTHGGRPTPAIQDFLDKVTGSDIKSIKVAAFDTRSSSRLVRIFGYAAEKIASSLTSKGGTLILSPEAFFVKATKGPLKEGELERAADWAKEITE
ncbi:MAG: flavodoxin family protein [Thermoplasmata archaeon]|nr:flavodoxin family protein [Thermoplasmata archaeon]